jgi:hypothetical protein
VADRDRDEHVGGHGMEPTGARRVRGNAAASAVRFR